VKFSRLGFGEPNSCRWFVVVVEVVVVEVVVVEVEIVVVAETDACYCLGLGQ